MASVRDQLAELAGVVETVPDRSVCCSVDLREIGAIFNNNNDEMSITSGGGSLLPSIGDDGMGEAAAGQEPFR